MAPRKKPSSKSNQNQPNSQPSKFGIQHFFLRHSQSSSSRPNDAVSSADPNPPSKSGQLLQNPTTACPENVLIPTSNAQPLESGLALQNPKTAPNTGIAGENGVVSASGNHGKALNLENIDPKNGLSTSQNRSNGGRVEAISNFGSSLNSGTVDSINAVCTWKKPRNDVPSASTSNSRKTDPNNSSQNTPPENIPAMAMDVEENPSQVSPEVSKSMALKRFKFSPGMLIKQSQDDGGDEVTWKISPVNERLEAMTKKHAPEVIRVLSDASRLTSLNFRQCSQNKTSPGSEGKLEKWLCSSTMKASEKSVLLSNRVSLKRVKLGPVMDSNGNEVDITDLGMVKKRQSPFRTPPSLSYFHEKNIDGVDCKLVSVKMGLRQNKKNIVFLRIGRHEVVHEEIQRHCFSGMDICSIEDIKQRLDQVKVVAATCLGITNPLLANKRFDICIMDEAGQATLPVSLGPLMFSSTFVLVGDHYQLPPLVQSVEARENGMGISLFCRLSEAHPQAISALQSQYRMCQGIMALSNALIYGNRLRCGSSKLANARLKFSSQSLLHHG